MMNSKTNETLDLSGTEPVIEIFESVSATLSNQFIKLFQFSDVKAAEKVLTEAAGATGAEFSFAPGTNPNRPIYEMKASLGNLLKTETLLFEKFQEISMGNGVCQNILASTDLQVLSEASMTAGALPVSEPVVVADLSLPLQCEEGSDNASTTDGGSTAPSTLQNASVSSSTENSNNNLASSVTCTTLPKADAVTSEVLSKLTALSGGRKTQGTPSECKVSQENKKYRELCSLLGFGTSQSSTEPVKRVVRVSDVVSPAPGRPRRSRKCSKKAGEQTECSGRSVSTVVQDSVKRQSVQESDIVRSPNAEDEAGIEKSDQENETSDTWVTRATRKRSLRSNRSKKYNPEEWETSPSLKSNVRYLSEESPEEVTHAKKSKVGEKGVEEHSSLSLRKSARLHKRGGVDELKMDSVKISPKARQKMEMKKDNTVSHSRERILKEKICKSLTSINANPDKKCNETVKEREAVSHTKTENPNTNQHHDEVSEQELKNNLPRDEMEVKGAIDTPCASYSTAENGATDFASPIQDDSRDGDQAVTIPESHTENQTAETNSNDSTCDLQRSITDPAGSVQDDSTCDLQKSITDSASSIQDDSRDNDQAVTILESHIENQTVETNSNDSTCDLQKSITDSASSIQDDSRDNNEAVTIPESHAEKQTSEAGSNDSTCDFQRSITDSACSVQDDSSDNDEAVTRPESHTRKQTAETSSNDSTCDLKFDKDASSTKQPLSTFEYSGPCLTEVQMFSEECGQDIFKILKAGDKSFVVNQGPTCPVCHQTFSTSQSMSAHIMYSHYKYKCQKCFAVFSDKGLLVEHLSDSSLCQGPRLKKRRKSVLAGAPPKQNKRKDLRCGDCDQVFGHRSRLDRHQLKAHKATIHCAVCEETFEYLARLRVHIDLFHTQQEEHVCDVCGKGFSVLANMLGHKKRHTLDRKFMCAVCGKAFRDKCTLQDHLDSHKPQEERQYRYVCSACGKRFRGKRMFLDHENTHTGDRPYRCRTCGRCYTGLMNLKHHIKETHNGIRIYKCELCPKAFKEKRNLTAHMVQHTGVSKYNCDHCGKPFGNAANLKVHLKGCSKSNAEATIQDADAVTEEIFPDDLGTAADSVAIAVENLPDVEQQVAVVETVQLAIDYETQIAGLEIPVSETEVNSEESCLYICGICNQPFTDLETTENHMNVCEGQAVVVEQTASS